MTELRTATNTIFLNLHNYLTQVTEAVYCKPVDALSNATLGQHTRHTLEFFECIAEQSASGLLSYDKRHRNHAIEVSPNAAMQSINNITAWYVSSFTDRHLLLQVALNESSDTLTLIPTTCLREWNYAVEHAIHHMAMIRIGAKLVAPELSLPDSFGMAPSTLKYRKQCAQ